MSPGIWASGEPVENLHYVAMVANSFNGLNLADNRIGRTAAFGGTIRWEPLASSAPVRRTSNGTSGSHPGSARA